MSSDSKSLHVGDPTELGRLVAQALEQPKMFGQGQHLAQASETTSWQGLVDSDRQFTSTAHLRVQFDFEKEHMQWSRK